MTDHHEKRTVIRIKRSTNRSAWRNTWWIVIGIFLLVGGGYMLFNQLNDYHKASHLYKYTAKQFVITEYEQEEHDDELTDTETDWENLIDVDIAALRRENKDIKGWIYFENEDISYPIL